MYKHTQAQSHTLCVRETNSVYLLNVLPLVFCSFSLCIILLSLSPHLPRAATPGIAHRQVKYNHEKLVLIIINVQSRPHLPQPLIQPHSSEQSFNELVTG